MKECFKIWLFGFGMLLLASSVNGQFLHTRYEALKESFHHKPGFLLGIDSRNSFVSGRQIHLLGAKIGVDLHHTLRIGVGGYGLIHKFEQNVITHEQDTSLMGMKFGYATAFVEYVWYYDKRWEVSTPLQMGGGAAVFHVEEEKSKKGLFVTGIDLMGKYKILPWLAVGGGIGYTVLHIPKSEFDLKLSSPTYAIKIKIGLIKLYKWTKENKKGISKTSKDAVNTFKKVSQ